MDYKGKKVLILGLGLNEGGVGSAKYFARHGAEVLVTDIKSGKELAPSIEKLKEYPEIKYHLGGHSNEDIDWADIIIRNQALKPDNKFLKYAYDSGKLVRTDIGIFINSVNPENIIAITGTKGKSTTSSLIYEVLKASGKNAIICGNIGKSVLESLDKIESDTLIVLEISSFQIESFDKNEISPKYAVITNIYPDHLNYYSSMDEYIAAKKLISKYQTKADFLFLNKDDTTLNSAEFLNGINSEIIFFSVSDLPKNFKPILPGEFNLSNFAAALSVSKILGIPETEAIDALENFKGLKYRMELIGNFNGVKIYNNTAATAPEPAIESLKTFPNCILIAGGMNKGLNFREFSDAIEKYSKEVFFLEGDATDEIKKQNPDLESKKVYNDLEKLLKDVKETAKPGDVILFSPGATSFNLFQNEFDRGKKFNEAAMKVFK